MMEIINIYPYTCVKGLCFLHSSQGQPTDNNTGHTKGSGNLVCVFMAHTWAMHQLHWSLYLEKSDCGGRLPISQGGRVFL